MAPTPRLSTTRNAFTLIEVLVVVAIIAILVAVLYPVFARARERARQTACVGNLKQLGAAIELYRADYGGAFPTSREPKPSDVLMEDRVFVSWTGMVSPYVKSGLDETAPISVRSKRFSGVYLCPSDTGQAGPSYAMNGWFLIFLGTGDVAQPAETVLIAEKRAVTPLEHLVWWRFPWPRRRPGQADMTPGHEDTINAIAPEPNEDPNEFGNLNVLIEASGLQTRRHNGGSNWLYADGHVKWGRLNQIWGNGFETNQLLPNR